MTKGDILVQYKKLSAEDQQAFGRWLRANAVVGSMFGLVLVVFALVRTEETATAPTPTSAQTISIQELHGSARLNNLPVDHIHDQALVFPETEPGLRSAMAPLADSTERR